MGGSVGGGNGGEGRVGGSVVPVSRRRAREEVERLGRSKRSIWVEGKQGVETGGPGEPIRRGADLEQEFVAARI